MTRAHSTRKQDFVRTQPLSGDESFIPNAQSDVHLRDCGVLRHITNHSGSAQDCFADGCSDGRVPHVAKASTPSSNREMATNFAGAMTRAQSKRKQEFVRTPPLFAQEDGRVTHVAKANSPSSNRQKAAYTAAAVTTAQSSHNSRRRKRKRANLKRNKQDEKLINIELPHSHSIVPDVQSQGRIIFVDGGVITNPPICPKPPTDINNNQTVIVIPVSLFQIPRAHLDLTDKGLIVKNATGPSQIILVPRASSLQYTGMYQNLKNPSLLCDALDEVESGIRTSNKRGNGKHVIHEANRKYCCIGTQTCRATRGIRSIHYALHNCDIAVQQRIVKYFRGVEHLFEMYVDTPQIRLIHDAINLVDAKTFSISSPWNIVSNTNPPASRIYGAFASGVNVYLNAHQDKDFTYCATSIHMRDQYQPSQRIVAYFAYTKLGIAIPLRPGDVLFFNPLEEHCISSRCCNDDDIYCLSLYLKSDNIGLNDNSKELTPQQEYLLNVYNNN